MGYLTISKWPLLLVLFKVCFKHNILINLISKEAPFPLTAAGCLSRERLLSGLTRSQLSVSLGSEHTVFSDQLSLLSKLG